MLGADIRAFEPNRFHRGRVAGGLDGQAAYKTLRRGEVFRHASLRVFVPGASATRSLAAHAVASRSSYVRTRSASTSSAEARWMAPSDRRGLAAWPDEPGARHDPDRHRCEPRHGRLGQNGGPLSGCRDGVLCDLDPGLARGEQGVSVGVVLVQLGYEVIGLSFDDHPLRDCAAVDVDTHGVTRGLRGR